MRALLSAFAAGIIALCCAPAAFADATPEYFNMPAGYNAGAGITTAPDGTVWFAADRPASTEATIARLLPAQASPGTANGIATFPTPALSASCCVHIVRSVAFDVHHNRVWFVQSDGIVGWADPALVAPGASTGMSARLLSTTTTSGPYSPGLGDVAVDRNGLAWFTETGSYNVAPYPGGRIASTDLSLGVNELSNIALQGGRSSLDPLRYDAKPAGIAVGADGRPWFAESDPGNPGWRIATPRGSDYDEYLVTPCAGGSPCSGSFTGTGITDVAVALDGSIWFTNQLRNEVGRLDVARATFTSYSLPGIDPGLGRGLARTIATAPDGSLWIAEYGGISSPNANALVKLVPSTDPNQPNPAATVFHLGRGRYPLAVAPDTRGNVWFTVATDVAPGLVGRLAGVIGAAPGGGGGGGAGGGGGGRVVRPASVGVARVGTPSTDGTRMTVDQICVGPPQDVCSLVYILSAHEYVTGFPNTRASIARKRRRAAKPRPLILGRKTVTLHGGQRKRVTISLNATGRRLLARASGGRLTVYFTATQAGARGKPAKRVKQAKVTFKLPRRHRHRRR